jgi:hypothetical protein
VIPISLSAGTVMAVFLMAVIVLGYVVIWAIWHFVFREAGDHVTSERRATVPQTRAGDEAPADGSDVPRVATHSASSSEDDRQA